MTTRATQYAVIALGISLLLTGCAFPKRDYQPLPDASSIQLRLKQGQLVAMPPNCTPMLPRNRRPSLDSRPQIAFGCATYTNLANSIANPRDLVAPHTYAGQSAGDAARAVERYRQGKVIPLNKTTAVGR